MGVDGTTPTRLSLVPIIELGTANNNAMNRSRENLAVTISADWRSPIVSATIYLRVAGRGSIIADVIPLQAQTLTWSLALATCSPRTRSGSRHAQVRDMLVRVRGILVRVRGILVRVRGMLAALQFMLATCSIAAWWTTRDSRFATKHAGSRQGSTIQ